MGRLLISLLFAEWNLPPQPLLHSSVYFKHCRQEYYDYLLAVSPPGEWNPWLRFLGAGSAFEQKTTSDEWNAGIVRELTGYAHNQIYRADEIFSALDNVQD